MAYGYSAYSELNISIKIIIFLISALLIDVYINRGVRILYKDLKNKLIRRTAFIFHWIIFLVFAGLIFFFFLRKGAKPDDYLRSRVYFLIITLFILNYFPKIIFSIFILMRDVLTFIKFSLIKLLKRNVTSNYLIRKYFLKIGLILNVIFFIIILHSILIQKYNFKIKTTEVVCQNLPPAFEGFKIVQFSDTHFGSFKKENTFEEAINIINNLKPDIIVFTGDMVNFTGREAKNQVKIFSKLNAKYGMYSILGNHDYADYILSYTQDKKDNSISLLKKYQEQMGFSVLENQSKSIKINNDSIEILGVGNWGTPPYKIYGNLDKAMQNTAKSTFKILLSHDPEHWEYEIVPKNYDINLTLSGHTHGGQFGIDIGKFKCSPISLKYKYWSGLYKEKEKYLYVNTGLGVIGFLGRIGIRPEISEIILKKY
ncbi:MAG: metallophosphoesterase [Bacteroidota bacterium]|nr:metallophosphoesterase [Bacteroidota bacterium]